jgi:hypothetical protein
MEEELAQSEKSNSESVGESMWLHLCYVNCVLR